MGVNLRRLDARMPEQLLDRVDVGPVHDEMAGERMTQGVERRALDAAVLQEFAEVAR